MISSVAYSVGNNSISRYYGISNSSNIFGTLGTLSNAFGFFDQWSGYLSGGLDAGLSFWGPAGFGFQSLGKYSSALNKFGVGMSIAGNVLSWGRSSVYNNFTNLNYTTGGVLGATIGFVGAFTIGGGVAVLVGIAGAVAIYYLGEWLDDGWKWFKEQIFE